MPWARQSPGSGRWGGVYRDGAGRVRYLPMEHRTKTEAKRAAAVEEDRARRTGRDHTAGRMLWGDWCDEWLPTRRIEASTERAASSYLRRVRERWDGVRLDEITSMELKRWVRELEREYAPSSVYKAFYLLSASLRAAELERKIDTNPCRGVELPPLPPAEERYLDDVEVGRILYHLDGVYRLLAELLLGTGMRLAEACGLHWHRVNLDAGTVDVIETWDKDAGEMKAYPKGRKRRTVPLEPGLVEVLVRLHDRNPDTGSCGRPHARYRAADARARARGVAPVDRCSSSLVLPGPKGAPIDGGNFTKRQWTRACEAAGVVGASPHALRHTYASRLVTEGVSLPRVQQLLGHSSIVTTQRYAHLQDEGHDEVRAALARRRHDAADDAAAGPSGARAVPTWRRPRSV